MHNYHYVDIGDATSITVASACLTCWLWLPSLSEVSKDAALILPIGGVILLVLNAWLILLKMKHVRRGRDVDL